MPAIKPLQWLGSTKKDFAAMPMSVQDLFGYALHLAQTDQKHSQAKPLSGFGGAGVLEVMETHQGNAYRAVYTVRYAHTVYVLHCFQKKSTRGITTPKRQIDLIKARLVIAGALERSKQP